MPLSTLPRGWRAVLLASLAVNLLVAGLFVGQLFEGHGARPGPRGEPLIAALPEGERAFLRERGPRVPRTDRRARFDALLAALRAEPFAPDALLAALRAQRQRGQERAARLEAALVARLSDMSAEDRAAYAARLEEGIRRGRPRGDR